MAPALRCLFAFVWIAGNLAFSPPVVAQEKGSLADGVYLDIITSAPDDVVHPIIVHRLEDEETIAAVFPYPITIRVASADFEIKADAAVIWTKRRSKDSGLQSGIDEFTSSIHEFDSLEFYAEGQVRASLGTGKNATIFRGEQLFLKVSRTPVPSPLIQGDFMYTFSGSIEDFRGHVDADAMEALRSATQADGKPAEDGLKIAGTAASGSGRKSSGIDPGVATDASRVESADDGGFSLEEGVKIFLRAQKARIHSIDTGGRVSAEFDRPIIATSSLAVPNFSFRATSLGLRLSKVRNTAILKRPSVYVKNTRLLTIEKEEYVYDIDSRFPVSRFSVGSSDAFGRTVQTKIDVITAYDFFWDPEPPFRPFKLSPIFEYYEKRGVGYGVELEIDRIQPFGTGFSAWMQGYSIHDRGDQRDIAREIGYFPLAREERGRFRGYGRLRYQGGWQVDTNINYQSDRTFIQEFLPDEYEQNDVDITFVRLTRKFGNRNFYLDATLRARHFIDEVERLPVLGFSTQRENIGPRGLGLQLSADAELGNFRMHMARSNHPLNEESILRGDLTMRVYRPTDFGRFTLDPYVGFRMTAADTRVVDESINTLYDPALGFVAPDAGTQLEKSGQVRFQGLFGATLQTNLTRVYPDVTSELFDMRGLRHIITPSIRWENVVGPGRDHSLRFAQLDEVDAAVNEQKVVLGVRNPVQTLRRYDGRDKTVDVANLLLELPLYPNRERDNGGFRFGDLEVLGELSPSRYVSFRGGAFIETRRGNWTRLFGSAATSIGPSTWRLYFRSMRGLHEIVGVNMDANLSKTYGLSVDQEYDMRTGRFRDTRVRISRTFYETLRFNFTVTRDSVREDVGFSISVSGTFGPASLGSK